MPYYTLPTSKVLRELNTLEHGLSVAEAKERLYTHGKNTIRITTEPLWRKVIEPFANIFVLVLFVAAAISLYHHDYLDASIIVVIIGISAAIYYIQRFSTERILRSLRKHETQDVQVFRGRKALTIDSSLLVPGDVIILNEGEKVPADARLLIASSLRVNESQLTGESDPVDKQTDAITRNKELYEQTNMIFQGSFVVGGSTTAIVTATGNATEFGRLAALTKETAVQSPVQKKIDRLITQIVAVVGAIALVAFALAQLRGMDITESLRFVIALSVSAVPESLPVAISVVLVLAMRRMAAKKALVRSMQAIETIGVITTIATDKTGTLTKNRLTVQVSWQPPHATSNLAHIIARSINHTEHAMHDPLDAALADYARSNGEKQPNQHPMLSLPFDQAAAMSGNIWHHGTEYDLAVKGAPEHVLAKSDLTEGEHEAALSELHKLTSSGYRVIALAHIRLPRAIDTFSDLTRKDALEFDGFVAVVDILRPEAKRAITAALNAGVTVRMITGDHFETAYHIGRQLGMTTHRDQVFDARRMNVMNDEELEEIIEHTRVFSRVIPEHKYRILQLLKKHSITAMTGDGVNDVPALAGADVGIAMGSGASIAKDAGDIILIDDNFKSIVDAMREGRAVYANIRRMLYYLLSTNAGEVLTMLGSLAIGLPVPLVPVQILWINLVTDTSMVIPLGLEPGEKANMTRKPYSPKAPILSKFLISRMILVALTMATLTISMYAFFSSMYGHEYGRTIAFSALVVMQWANAFNARSDSESVFTRLRVFNGKFYTGLSVAIILQLLVLLGPLGSFLHITPIAIGDLATTGVIAFVVPILFVEVHKYISRRYAVHT